MGQWPWHSAVMDHLLHFRREAAAFEAAARRASAADEAPLVPSCPDWSVSDLVIHLGSVHRLVAHVIRERMQEPPDQMENLLAKKPSETLDLSFLGLPEDTIDWPRPESEPNRGPLPAGLLDWYAQGAGHLASLFAERPADEPVWTWWQEQTVGFWLRIQTIETAVHRWDAENALGGARPLERDLAEDTVAHSLEVMVPARRAWRSAPAGEGERYRFRQTDGTNTWTVVAEGESVHLDTDADAYDVELSATASDLALFLWNRLPADSLGSVSGHQALLERWFTLVPPV